MGNATVNPAFAHSPLVKFAGGQKVIRTIVYASDVPGILDKQRKKVEIDPTPENCQILHSTCKQFIVDFGIFANYAIQEAEVASNLKRLRKIGIALNAYINVIGLATENLTFCHQTQFKILFAATQASQPAAGHPASSLNQDSVTYSAADGLLISIPDMVIFDFPYPTYDLWHRHFELSQAIRTIGGIEYVATRDAINEINWISPRLNFDNVMDIQPNKSKSNLDTCKRLFALTQQFIVISGEWIQTQNPVSVSNDIKDGISRLVVEWGDTSDNMRKAFRQHMDAVSIAICEKLINNINASAGASGKSNSSQGGQ